MSSVDTERGEALAAAAGGADKRAYVRRIFSEIAPRYDFLNHLLSLNVDRRWRRRALAALGWERHADGTYVDLCAGTLDVGIQLGAQRGFRGFVVGADFAEPMLRVGQRKTKRVPVGPVVADVLQLPLAEGSAAGAIVAFGIRNLADLDAGLRDIHRVLTAGARLVILEFSTPRSPPIRWLYHAYFHRVLPRVGGWVSGHPTAYRYLPESVISFPTERELARRMEEVGFRHVRWQSLSFGIAAIHVGERSGDGAGTGP